MHRIVLPHTQPTWVVTVGVLPPPKGHELGAPCVALLLLRLEHAVVPRRKMEQEAVPEVQAGLSPVMKILLLPGSEAAFSAYSTCAIPTCVSPSGGVSTL